MPNFEQNIIYITSKYYKMNENPPLEGFLVNLKMYMDETRNG